MAQHQARQQAQQQQQFNLNKVNAEELSSRVRMIGKDRAERLIKYRSEYGPFKDWRDLDNVPGLSKGLIEDIKNSGATLDGGGRKER
ncbi:MAG: helix-hairpin-helix domain-containing protein [Deltaproteobacteria bacterium]|nr:helix-hairpin-helix domain-containing protein [Deltaproteobacteria bacterium]